MTEIFFGLASLAPVALAGCLLLLALDWDNVLQPLERLVLGYAMGSGILAWEMLVYQAAGVSFSALKLFLPLLVVSAVIFRLVKRADLREHRPALCRKASFDHVEWFLIAAIALAACGALLRASLLPMEAYDAVSNWGLKAKAIFLAGRIPEGFLQNPNYEVFHPDYPLLVPLLESYIYSFVGGLREGSAKVVFPLFLAGCCIVLFASLTRAGQSRRSSLLFSFLLVSIPYFAEQATNGYADVAIGFYFGAGSLYLYLWQTTGKSIFLPLSALCSGFAALTKNKGELLAGFHLIWLMGVLILRPCGSGFRARALGLYAGILAGILMPWYLFKVSLGLRNDVLNRDVLKAGLDWSHLNRLGPIAYQLQTQVFGPKNWNLIWIVLGAAAIWRRKVLFRPPVVFMTGLIGLTVSAYMSVYLITPYTIPPFDVAWHLRTSASRLLVHVLPHVVFVVGLAFGETEDA